MSTLNERLKSLRTERQLTKKVVAQSCGICERVLSYYETGERVPRADVLIRFCKYFNVSSDYLLGLSEHMADERLGCCK